MGCNIFNISCRSYARLFIIIFFSFLTAGCHKNKEPLYKIGVSQCSSDEWREKMNNEMKREMLFHDDSILEIRSADDDNQKQIADIEYFLENGFDAIIVAPNETDAITPEVKKVYEAGIPVIIFDRRVRGDEYTAYIDLDNQGIGYAAAEYAYSLFGDKECDLIEITGLPGSSPAIERHNGFVKGLKRYPNFNLKASVNGYWDREKARFLADSLLSIYPSVKAIYAHSDNMAIGVSEICKQIGREDIKILGTDASPGQGLEAVRDGVLDATFIYPTEGHRIIRTTFSILEGEPYEKTVHLPALTSVDKSNAEILIRQNELLDDETQKVLLLDEYNEELENRHNALNRFLNTVVVLAIVLALSLFIIILVLIRNGKLRKELEDRNRKLIEERDKQIQLYKTLDVVLSKDNEFYNQFMAIIKADYADASLSTESLATKLNLGGAQLTRKIKALTNYSPVELLRNYRLEQARDMIINTNKSVNEITFAVGFSSAAYLTKCFREHYGITPTELRTAK